MTRFPVILITAVVALAHSASAEAGLMVIVDDDAVLSNTISTASSGSLPNLPTDPSQTLEMLTIAQHHAWNNASGSGSLSGTGSTSTGGNAPSAILNEDIDSSAPLVARLGAERYVWVPPPFMTGVFRPPRQS